MELLDLREPNKVINMAIDIVDELKCDKTRELIKINKMNEVEREEIDEDYIMEICLEIQQYEKIIDDLEKVRDFASEKFLELLHELTQNRIRGRVLGKKENLK